MEHGKKSSRRCYVIDTSSLVNISGEDASEAAWELIVRLIREGRLKTVPFVMDELERVDPQAYEKANPYRDELVIRNTPEILLEAGRITRKYPTCLVLGEDMTLQIRGLLLLESYMDIR